MPLYEYKCQQCHRHTEKRQKFSDVEITVCPHCGGTLQRVITAPAIAFKGGGWFKDGYGNAKPASPEASGNAESKPDKAETKTDSPAAPASGNSDSAAASPASTPAPPPAASPAPASASKT